MAKAIASSLNVNWVDVYLDSVDPDARIGWACRANHFSCRTAWVHRGPVLAREVQHSHSGRTPEEDVRWILEQIPGCADLEIEWVNE